MRRLHSRFLRTLIAIVGAFSAFATAVAQADHYELDPVHTRIVFSCNHFGYSNVLGTFARPSGALVFDPDDWTSATLDVSVELATLEVGDATFAKRLLKRDYLFAKKHPKARFVSTKVEPSGENRAKVHGELTLRGVTRPLTLDVTLNKLARNRYALMKKVAGFSATATLNRADWGIDDNPGVVGATVELRIEAEAVRTTETQ